MQNKINVLMIGDVVGGLGRAALQKHLPHIKKKYDINFTVVNGENSAAGKGITSKIMRFFKHIGADIVTTGNHIWAKREIYQYLKDNNDLLRPANFPSECPGTGIAIVNLGEYKIGVMNVQGRVFMRELLSCPFKTTASHLTYIKSKTNIILVDFHAETTSEKMGFAHYFDGQVSAVVGTHTHVQTADERILSKGTAFITDLGMCGALDSMLGMKKEPIINHLITQMPTKFEVENSGPAIVCGVIISIDVGSGKALSIERIKITDTEIKFETKDKDEE